MKLLLLLWVCFSAVSPSQSDARMQGLQFLQDLSHDIQQLYRNAAVAKLGQILLPRRNRLQNDDEMFEIQQFLNKNAHFVA